MASSYSLEDQAADLGIHRIHTLVLGDAKKETRVTARFAAMSASNPKRAVLGHGDARYEDWEYESAQRRELAKIARRQNLKSTSAMYEDADTLTNKIAAWGTLKVENVIQRPDGLGTGNAHRGGPNYRPIASFGQPRRPAPLNPRAIRYAAPGTSTFAARTYFIPPAGSVAAAWQAAAMGKKFHPFALAGNSSISVGHVPTKPPVRTPARKSVVGSPRTKTTAPPAEPSKTIAGGTYADRMDLTSHSRQAGPCKGTPKPIFTIIDGKVQRTYSSDTSSQGSRDSGSTYADQMQALQSKLSSDHAPAKPEEATSPKRFPKKPADPLPPREDTPMSFKSPPRQASQPPEGSRWTGGLATAKDPYFNQTPSKQFPAIIPVVALPPVANPEPLSTTSTDGRQNAPATTTAAGTPSSISLASTDFDIAEYLGPIDDTEDESQEQRYDADPEREDRDLEINRRVNQSIAEAEEAALAREILSPRTRERKSVQFAEGANVVHEAPESTEEVDLEHLQVLTKPLYVWDSFRDFVTVRTITGFEEWVPVPRILRGEDYVAPESPDCETVVDPDEEVKSEQVSKMEEKDQKHENSTPATRSNPPTMGNCPVKATWRAAAAIAAEVALQLEEKLGFAVRFHQYIPPSQSSTSELSEAGIAVASTPSSGHVVSTLPAGLVWTFQLDALSPVARDMTVQHASASSKDEPDHDPLEEAIKPATSFSIGDRGRTSQDEEITGDDVKDSKASLEEPKVNIGEEYGLPRVSNTWDLPTVPSTRSNAQTKKTFSHEETDLEEFLLGLDQSKKAHPTPLKRVTILDTKSHVDEEKKVVEIAVGEMTNHVEKKAPLCQANAQAPHAPASQAPTPPPAAVALTSTPPKVADVKPKQYVPQIRPTPSYTSMAGPIPSLSRPMISSPPSSVTSPRSGLPMPMPVPPTPRPAMKSPPKKSVQPAVTSQTAIIESGTASSQASSAKPSVAPKPFNLSSAPTKKDPLISPLVGGLVDPFLQGLEPKAKKEPPAPRPQSPVARASSSAEYTSSKTCKPKPSAAASEEIAVDLAAAGTTDSSSASASASPMFLNGSWTLVKASKGSPPRKESPPLPPFPEPKEVLAPVSQGTQHPHPSSPVRRTWFSSEPSPTPVPTPATTPIVTPEICATLPSFVDPNTSISKPTTEVATRTPRKLFTFELKVGETLVSTPVYDNDNPTVVAREFAQKHDFESRLPGGKDTVDKIVSYFENQFAARKKEREKRRAERMRRLGNHGSSLDLLF